MKKYICLLPLIFATSTHAQSISYKTVNSSGNVTTAGSIQISQSIGDIGGSVQGATLLAGFQQSFAIDNLSIHDLNTNTSDISIYPNPCIDQLTILSSQKMAEISLRNLLGQKLISLTGVLATSFKLDVSERAVGPYYLSIRMENGIENTFQIHKK